MADISFIDPDQLVQKSNYQRSPEQKCPDSSSPFLHSRQCSSMEPFTVIKEQILARLWQLASLPPEETEGWLKAQIGACKCVYEKVRYVPAVRRLNEIANTGYERHAQNENRSWAADEKSWWTWSDRRFLHDMRAATVHSTIYKRVGETP